VTTKSALRTMFLERRMQIPADLRAISAAEAFDLFFQAVSLPQGAIVAGYWPMRGELDDMPILHEVLKRGHLCALPHVAAKEMPLVFRAWNEGMPMVISPVGISEPAPEAPLLVPDILLVPLAAFDTKRHRLGYGAGYYDRTIAGLKELKPLLAVGLGYEGQRCDALPAEEHDIQMDMIVTDRNIYK
jgi:5-formyltetrahydrofolate cyclo-ligase